jgi:serine/threonine protein kinase
LRGLVALHDREVVHRDVKPENLALRGGDWAQPVLLDLGLGRLLDSSTLTAYPAMVGTAPYMAPEIIEGRAARKGSDLWSLGVVTHLLLARQHPFYSDPAEVLDADEAYDRLIAGSPALPAGTPVLSDLVSRLLAATSYSRGSAARALRDLEP